MTGNGPALGDNDPLNGVPLYTTPSEYPRWSSDWGKRVDWRDECVGLLGFMWLCCVVVAGSRFVLMCFFCRMIRHPARLGDRVVKTKLTPRPPPRSNPTVSVATNAELTYKYAIFEGVKFSHWEPIGTNKEGTRTVRVQEDQVGYVGSPFVSFLV